jgi:hypothetical protein
MVPYINQFFRLIVWGEGCFLIEKKRAAKNGGEDSPGVATPPPSLQPAVGKRGLEGC